MKLLLLVQDEQRVILDRLYEGISHHADAADVRRLTSAEQANLKGYVHKHVDVTKYDRIFTFLRFKKELKQIRFIRSIPNLVMLEHDACQNYIPSSKYFGEFSRLYRSIPWVRVIVSGHALAERLRAEGHDAVFVSKGYDQALLSNQNIARDIELGFIGSMSSRVYRGRQSFLEKLSGLEPLQIVSTPSGKAYGDALNRIRFFVSCDMGLGEYMIKNFEAMACGCVLLAWRQRHGEEEALGFCDMKNVVLYNSIEELREKLSALRNSPSLARNIADKGQALATARYGYNLLGKQIVEAAKSPLRNREDYPMSFWRRLFP